MLLLMSLLTGDFVYTLYSDLKALQALFETRLKGRSRLTSNNADIALNWPSGFKSLETISENDSLY